MDFRAPDQATGGARGARSTHGDDDNNYDNNYDDNHHDPYRSVSIRTDPYRSVLIRIDPY